MTRNVKSLVFVYFGASDMKYILIGRTLVTGGFCLSVTHEDKQAREVGMSGNVK